MNVNEILSVNDTAIVQNLRGKVIKAEWVQAYPTGIIPLHTIRFTEKRERKRLSNDHLRHIWIPLDKPIIKECNYSFINN
jgi:hypothetical protein